MCQTRPLFVSFRPFLTTMTNIKQNLTIDGRSLNGVLGIRNRDHRVKGADESTELWRPLSEACFCELFVAVINLLLLLMLRDCNKTSSMNISLFIPRCVHLNTNYDQHLWEMKTKCKFQYLFERNQNKRKSGRERAFKNNKMFGKHWSRHFQPFWNWSSTCGVRMPASLNVVWFMRGESNLIIYWPP